MTSVHSGPGERGFWTLTSASVSGGMATDYSGSGKHSILTNVDMQVDGAVFEPDDKAKIPEYSPAISGSFTWVGK